MSMSMAHLGARRVALATSATRRSPVMVVRAQAGAAAPSASSPAARGVPQEVSVESKRASIAADMQWFRVPPKVYFKGGCLEVALAELVGRRRALVVTDKNVVDISLAERVTELLDRYNIQHQTFYHVNADVSATTLAAGLRELQDFKPDVIIAVGGGAPMDAAKAMWFLYESPNTSLQQLIADAAKGRHNIGTAVQLGQKALCVCVPTTSGTGAEVTPFALVKDETTGHRITLSSYSMTPSMAVVDPQLVMQLPRKQTAYGGMLTLSHAFESYISVFASDFSRSQSKHAMAMMNKYYERAYKNGTMDYHAREKMHNAATVAGMAFANAYLGAGHSLASEVAQVSGVHLGLVAGVLLPHVLAFMAKDPATKEALADLADHLHVGGTTVEERYQAVMLWIEDIRAAGEIPMSLQDVLGPSATAVVSSKLDSICALAMEDAHFIASPIVPTPADLKAILVNAGL